MYSLVVPVYRNEDSIPELIQVLESSSMFRNVQFTSPTTAGQQGQERFAIVMEVEE